MAEVADTIHKDEFSEETAAFMLTDSLRLGCCGRSGGSLCRCRATLLGKWTPSI